MGAASEQVSEIRVNLDDLEPRLVAAALEALLAEGALDVWTTAIGMKKNRPGQMLCLLCDPSDRDRLADRLIELTGSFGVRFTEWSRRVLERRIIELDCSFGSVEVKVGERNGRVQVVQPEYESCAALARKKNQDVRMVLEAARAAAQAWMQAHNLRVQKDGVA